jgi:hypothetical protein
VKLLDSEQPLPHHLPAELIVGGLSALLPALAIDGDDNSRAVEGHLFHLVPMLANILGVANAPAVIDEFFCASLLCPSGGTPEGEAQHTPWQQSIVA